MNRIFCGILISLLFSCSTFRETHYFKDNLIPAPNYYKVEVRGSTLLSSSRYVSGYYERGAVQTYFGEINQPDKGLFPVASKNEGDKEIVLNNGLDNKELVLLLSTNSDAIATSIGNLVKSKTVVNSIALLANKDKLEEAREVQNLIDTEKHELTLLKANLDAILSLDAENGDGSHLKSRILEIVKKELAKETSLTLPDTFSELSLVHQTIRK